MVLAHNLNAMMKGLVLGGDWVEAYDEPALLRLRRRPAKNRRGA